MPWLAVYKSEDGSIMHAKIRIGGSTIMMGQSNEDWSTQNAGLYINVENADDTFRKALDQGASVIMPLKTIMAGRAA